MADLTDFQRGMIVGARLAGATVTKTAGLVGVARGTVSNVMNAYETRGKKSSAKENSGRKSKLTEEDREKLKQIVGRKDFKTVAQITIEMNNHLKNPVSIKTIRRALRKECIDFKPEDSASIDTIETDSAWLSDHKPEIGHFLAVST